MHKVYYAKITPLEQKKRYQFYFNNLPLVRKEKANNYLKRIDKIRSVAAFSLLLKLLKDNKIKYKNSDFKIDKNGKLYLKDSNIFINISHSGDYVIAGLSNNPIGVDVEDINREAKYQELIKYVLNNEETTKFNKSTNKRKYFFEIWTKKESYLKCIGEGLKVAMPSIKENKFKDYYFKLFLINNHQFAICNKGEPVKNIKEIKL